MKARHVAIPDFAGLLADLLGHPVFDKTALTGRYDFDLEWAPDETQFGGALPTAPADAQAPPLFTAMRDQLGLEFKPTRGLVSTLVVDGAELPAEN